MSSHRTFQLRIAVFRGSSGVIGVPESSVGDRRCRGLAYNCCQTWLYRTVRGVVNDEGPTSHDLWNGMDTYDESDRACPSNTRHPSRLKL